MSQFRHFEPHEVEHAFKQAVASRPDARVAAVRADGLFCEMPPTVPLNGQSSIDALAGIELVAAEFKSRALEQFRQLGESGASEIEVRLLSGASAVYSLFDLRRSYGVIMLMVMERGEGEGRSWSTQLNDVMPVTPRAGRVKRTGYGKFIDVDDSLLAMLGYTREEFAAIDTVDAVHSEDYGALIGHWFDLLSAEPGSTRRARVRYLCKDATWLWVEITVTRHLDHPDEPHMLSEIVDISEEMAAIEEVWRSRELLRRLTEALPVGVLQIDTTGQVVYSNDRLLQLLATPRARALSSQFRNLADEDRDAVDHMVQSTLDKGIDGMVECRFRPANGGEIRSARLNSRALRNRDNDVSGAIICISDETESTRLRNELHRRASLDMLTQCLNRASVMDEIGQALERAASGTALIFVDLDRFKPVNDSFGHAAGDELLKAVAAALEQVVRRGDSVGRLGGDEFVVLCPDVPDLARAEEIGRRVALALRFDATLCGEIVPVRASIGVAWTERETTPDELVARADQAMYESKRSGTSWPVLAVCG